MTMPHHYLLFKAAAAVGALTGVSAAVIDERTHVPIGVAVSVGVFACGVVLWIGMRLQKLTDNIKEETTSRELLNVRLDALGKRLDLLPCNEKKCPANET